MNEAQPSQEGGITATDIATAVGGTVLGDSQQLVSGVCHVARPEAGKLCFTSSPETLLSDPTSSGAVLIAPTGGSAIFCGTAILVDNPRLAYARAVGKFYSPRPEPGIAPSAVVDPTATIAASVTVGAGCVIGANVKIDEGCQLQHNVIVGAGVQIGLRCVVGSNTVIGEWGFGLVKDETGANIRIPHLGSVIIGDDVEFGALCTIVAGTIEPTRVGKGVKTDDHVHIAHNCNIGQDAVITACAELSGSVTIGARTWLGPNVSIRDGITIAGDCVIGIGSTVAKSIDEPGVYVGSPARLVRKNANAPAKNDG